MPLDIEFIMGENVDPDYLKGSSECTFHLNLSTQDCIHLGSMSMQLSIGRKFIL